MAEALVTNLKYTLLIIGKAGTRERDCPINPTIYGTMIDWLFNDPSNHPKIIKKYRENRKALDKKLNDEGTTFTDAIRSHNRIIFKYIDLFPENTMREYGPYLKWFANYLQVRVPDNIMVTLSRYLVAMDDNLKKIPLDSSEE